MIRAAFIAVMALMPSVLSAQDFQAMQKASSMGKLIGSETYCGLSFDQAAIDAWIEQNMKPDDLEFSGYIELGIAGEGYDQEDRSDSAKTAHCAAVRRSAIHLGLVKEVVAE